MFELNNKNTFISLMVVVKKTKFCMRWLNTRFFFCYYLNFAAFAESRLVLIESLESAQAKTEPKPSKNAETRLDEVDLRPRPISSTATQHGTDLSNSPYVKFHF